MGDAKRGQKTRYGFPVANHGGRPGHIHVWANMLFYDLAAQVAQGFLATSEIRGLGAYTTTVQVGQGATGNGDAAPRLPSEEAAEGTASRTRDGHLAWFLVEGEVQALVCSTPNSSWQGRQPRPSVVDVNP